MGLKVEMNRDPGVCHGDDLMYLFPMNPPGFPEAVDTKPQEDMRQRLLDIVCSFTKMGEPVQNIQKGCWTPLKRNSSKLKQVTAYTKKNLWKPLLVIGSLLQYLKRRSFSLHS